MRFLLTTEAQWTQRYGKKVDNLWEARAYTPGCALVKRLLRHADEGCRLCLIAGLSADNNRAERSFRPLVVIRTISGGLGSAEGTRPRMGRASLCATWQARKLNPFDECLTRLNQSADSPAYSSLPQQRTSISRTYT